LTQWRNLVPLAFSPQDGPNESFKRRAFRVLRQAQRALGLGEITVPLQIAEMPDRVVWLPVNSAGCAVRGGLGAGHGTLVTVRSAE